MKSKYRDYLSLKYQLPKKSKTWNMYGAGVENIGKGDKPEIIDIPQPNDDQILVRIDAVGLCFSDVKLIKQGSAHPKLYNRDLKKEPSRLGHEASLTVVKVGKNLRDRFAPAQRYAMQPDIYQKGISTAYGYTIPGGLIQYHLIGKEILETDAGSCLLRVDDGMGIGESALLEPWGCVFAAYTQRRRLTPKKDGIMWIVGNSQAPDDLLFSSGLERPKIVYLSDVPKDLESKVREYPCETKIRNNMELSNYKKFAQEATGGKGFDDIVLLNPTKALQVETIARFIARRGTMNIVGTKPLDRLVMADVGRLHYDYTAYLGTKTKDIANSYGEARNRCDLLPNGSAAFIGAGGPMGQMHVQRAIEKEDGPKLVIVTDINDKRLNEMKLRFLPMAEKHNRKVLIFNPLASKTSFFDFVQKATNGKNLTDVVVCVPNKDIMAEAATLMDNDAMLVFFAGVPNGTLAPLDFSIVYLNNAQYTGTSGLTIEDQKRVMSASLSKQIDPARSIAAIGGMDVAKEGIEAMMKNAYPGKIMIFPQLTDLPLMGVDEIKDNIPDIASALIDGYGWSKEAEQELIDKFWELQK